MINVMPTASRPLMEAIRRMLHQAEPDSIQRTLVEPEIEAKEKRRKDIRDIKDIKEIKEKTAEKEDLSKEKRFEEILARLIRDVELSEHKEGRYRRLDETIRRHQMSRKMVAATEENSGRKGRKKRIKRKQSE
ncbi:MAG: hypothetical protein EOM18_07680 [Clostridia bacterium]|nr:hypothetical protein [Clostridia bacterium]